ncbi:hypothetical protein [Micromonospora violae]|uniref:hypothetical protein n=1 Tax=Micromonospora violae TaxID=1278207 RepID=UPI0033FF781B
MGPSSIMGRWLRADAVRDVAARDGLPDDPADEDAGGVIDAAFELVVHKRFAPDCHVRDITLFVSEVARQFRQKKYFPVREAEAMLRECLGEPAPTGDIEPVVAGVIKTQVIKALVEELALFDVELDRLLVEAEQLAVERGYRPTPAPSQQPEV